MEDRLPDIQAAMATPAGRDLLIALAALAAPGRPLKHKTGDGGASEKPGGRGLCVRKGPRGAWRWDDRTGILTTHEGRTGGDAVDLWKRVYGTDTAAAIHEVATALGITGTPAQKAAIRATIHATAQQAAATTAAQQSKRAAQRTAQIAEAITRGREERARRVADLYLTGTRGIPEPPGGWPASILWQIRYDTTHPDAKRHGGGRHPFILYAAHNDAGEIVAIQRAALTQNGRLAWRKQEGTRKTWGDPVTGKVWIQRPEDAAALALTEGVEDGLALAHLARAAGVSLAVAAALGTANATKIAEAWAKTETPDGLPFLAAFDRDAAGATAARKATRAFFEQARPALSFLPPPALGVKDWNEAIRDPAAPAIIGTRLRRRLACLAQMTAAYQDRRRGAPGYELARDPQAYADQMAAATQAMTQDIAGFFNEARRWDYADAQRAPGSKAPQTPPPTRLILTTLGGGKTAATMNQLARQAQAWGHRKAAQDGGPAPFRGLCLFPRFEMAREAYETFQQACARLRIYIPAVLIGGRGQPNTYHPGGPMGGALCIQPKTAVALGAGHGDARQSVRAQLCPGCPAFQACQTRHNPGARALHDPGTPGGYLAQGDIIAMMGRNGGIVFTVTDYLHGDLPGPAPSATPGAAASSFGSTFTPHVTIIDERIERSTRSLALGPREWAQLSAGDPFDATGAPLHDEPATRAAWMAATGWDPDAAPAPTIPQGSRHGGLALRQSVEHHRGQILADLGTLRAILEGCRPARAVPGATRSITSAARRKALDLFKPGAPLDFFRRAVASLEERDPRAPTIRATATQADDLEQSNKIHAYEESRGLRTWRAFLRLRATLRRADAADRRRAKAGLPPIQDPRAWVEMAQLPGGKAPPFPVIRTAELRLDEAGGALWQRVRKRPILALDATGDPEILAAIFPARPVTTARVEFPRHPRTILEGDPGEGWSKSATMHNGARSRRGQQTADQLAGRAADLYRVTGQPIGLIGTKQQIAAVWGPALDARGIPYIAGNFQDLRGSNKWEKCAAIIIVGVEIGPEGGLGHIAAIGADDLGPLIQDRAGIETEARALAAALGRPFEPADPEDWPTAWACVGPAHTNRAAIMTARHGRHPARYLWSTWRHYADGTRARFLEPRHPDPLGRAVLWQRIHAEIIQALHRVRQVRHPRHLVALNGLALPEIYTAALGGVSTWGYAAGGKTASATATASSAPDQTGKQDAA